jgi:hypothetical protein
MLKESLRSFRRGNLPQWLLGRSSAHPTRYGKGDIDKPLSTSCLLQKAAKMM